MLLECCIQEELTKYTIQRLYLIPSGELNYIESQKTSIEYISIFSIIVFLVISVVIALFIYKTVIGPIVKLTKNAERIAAGDLQYIETLEQVEGGNEINDLIHAFGIMTTELKDKLNEVSRQKSQIETILLHMTDGIIAFDIKGEIIHINPAASRLLQITSEQKTFNQIFTALEVDVNLEKIIYLENWTSSEQKVSTKDKILNMFFASFKDESNKPARCNCINTGYNRNG